ncbi:MAG: NUDIX domain-containing protein [Chloroflexi bacterium]|nr:NUDIX domain-containing protein [Chloroflexota bacterium]MCI0579707.1 NUDIX domain-containing protein [Chloroflexota bacterium]MCI0644140.1 NUDIX domain-containing protein [Chloroflexota bacterium]MCI0726230.1 NUDIX domain-containing protein [Chloroflexota bacterium]
MTIGRFLAGIGALVWDPAADKYLLLKRSAEKDFGAGSWECVTGRLDQGEGFEEALHREVQEEIGVAVQPLFILGTTHFYRGAARPENELIGVVYLCTIADPAAVRLGPEHSEYRWLAAGKAEALLSGDIPAEYWLARLIRRAEYARPLLPAGLLEFHRQHGFELNS